MSEAYLRLCNTSYARARRRLLPRLHNSQFDYVAALRTALAAGSGRWLDLGCGHAFLPDWLSAAQRRLELGRWRPVGVDLDGVALRRHPDLKMRVHANIEQLPFPQGTFSLVTANMVVEHVRQPSRLFAEVARVLVPGGTLLVHTPNRVGYTTLLTRLIPTTFLASAASLLLGRHSQDVYPTYYRANSTRDLTTLAERHSLRVEEIDHVLSSPQFIRVPPLMVLELLWLRVLERERRAGLRPCLVACFRRNAENPLATGLRDAAGILGT